jgi:tripartite-type tricarboxylate transporter receptor subunit TctC
MGRSAAGRFAFIVTIAALALIGGPAAAEPQGFPSKPVRIIVPYTAGSPNDVVARLLAQQLQVKLGQPVVVDNKPGGGKANPGKLSLGFAQGTVSQLVAEYFNHLYGLDITSVPYRGGALVIPDMLGGRIHIYWPSPATVLPLIREGKIKALAISSPERNPDLPNVPTTKELGLSELSLEFWTGAWAPAGTPAEIVEKLNAAINAALQSPELIASMNKLGFESRIGSAQDFAAFVTAEIPRWTAVVKASGVKSQ